MIELEDIQDPYVSLITDRIIEIKANSGRIGRDLAGLGFEPDLDRRGIFHLPFGDDAQRTGLMAQIRDLGVPFSDGPGWAPSGIFAELRDQGDLSGPFKKIAWRAKNRIVITDE